MNKGFAMMLKAMGIQITDEQIALVEALIPQIPSRLQQASQAVNGAITNFDLRLRSIEDRQAQIIQLLSELLEKGHHNGEHRSIGNGLPTV